jgi:hypothetical protein
MLKHMVQIYLTPSFVISIDKHHRHHHQYLDTSAGEESRKQLCPSDGKLPLKGFVLSSLVPVLQPIHFTPSQVCFFICIYIYIFIYIYKYTFIYIVVITTTRIVLTMQFLKALRFFALFSILMPPSSLSLLLSS